jgi:hypothetical protein
MIVTDLATTDVAASGSAFTVYALNANAGAVGVATECVCKVNASSQLGTRATVANNYSLSTKGYIDRRGQDD